MSARPELVAELVGTDPARCRLYQTSPWFHASIEQLAQLIPYMVDGLAVAASDAEAARDASYRALMAGLVQPVFDAPEARP